MLENLLFIFPLFLVLGSIQFAKDVQKPLLFVFRNLYACEMMSNKSCLFTKILYNIGFISYNIIYIIIAIEYRNKYKSEWITELIFSTIIFSVIFSSLAMLIHGQNSEKNLKIHSLFAILWFSMITQTITIIGVIYYPFMLIHTTIAFISLIILGKYSKQIEIKKYKTKSVIIMKILILLQFSMIYIIFFLRL